MRIRTLFTLSSLLLLPVAKPDLASDLAIVGEIVLLFAVLQWLGIRRIKKSAQFA